MKMNISTLLATFALTLTAIVATPSASAQAEAPIGANGFITTVCTSDIIVPTSTASYSSETRAFKLTSVNNGSAASYAGLKSGDILLTANGMPLSDHGQLRQMRIKLASNGSVNVAYLRCGKYRTTTISNIVPTFTN